MIAHLVEPTGPLSSRVECPPGRLTGHVIFRSGLWHSTFVVAGIAVKLDTHDTHHQAVERIVNLAVEVEEIVEQVQRMKPSGFPMFPLDPRD